MKIPHCTLIIPSSLLCLYTYPFTPMPLHLCLYTYAFTPISLHLSLYTYAFTPISLHLCLYTYPFAYISPPLFPSLLALLASPFPSRLALLASPFPFSCRLSSLSLLKKLKFDLSFCSNFYLQPKPVSHPWSCGVAAVRAPRPESADECEGWQEECAAARPLAGLSGSPPVLRACCVSQHYH